MKKVNLVVKSKNCLNSFYSSAVYVKSWLHGKFLIHINERPNFTYFKNIVIDDYVFYFRRPFYFYDNLILWLDSPLSHDNIKIFNKKFVKYEKIITTSMWNKEELEKVFNDEIEIIGRLVNPIVFLFYEKQNKKEYDFIIIGNYDKYADRKYIILIENVLSELQEKYNFKICAISNYHFNKIKNKEIYVNVDEFKKFELISKSKFILHIGTGGFEIPIFEGAILGTIPIYSSVLNAYVEFIDVGFKVDAEIEKRKTKYGIMYFAKHDIEHLKQQIINALELDKKEYETISNKCKEKTKELMIKFYNDLIKLLKY